MIDLTRRKILAASAGATAAGLISPASAADSQPPALYGSAKDGKVELPPLHGPSEGGGDIANPLPPGKRLGVAVVGIGHLSLEQIIPAFGTAERVKLTALVSGRRDKALAIAAEHGVPEKSVYDYTSFDKIKDDPSVDIVYIVLPNAMHPEFTERSAAAGKHVLCEKPMAADVASAQRMIKACRDANRKLMIAYRLQYDANHRALIDMARKKTFGELRFIEAVNGQNDAPNGQWRQIKALAGGGSLPDVGIYCLNAFRYITGEEPIEVTGRITQPKGDPRFREIEDIATFTLAFPSGVLASGSCGYSFHESRQLRCMAADAWFGLDPAFTYNGLITHIGKKAGDATAREDLTRSPKNQFAVEMDAFAEAIAAGREPHTPGEEGLQDMKIMAAIYEAAAGGSAVKLPASTGGLDATRGPLPASKG